MSFGYGPASDRKESIAVIRAAHERGVTLFDTAEAYGPLTNEDLVGRRSSPFTGRERHVNPTRRETAAAWESNQPCAGTPDECGSVAALLMGPDGAFITGSDFLMDGGVPASHFFGELAPQQSEERRMQA